MKMTIKNLFIILGSTLMCVSMVGCGGSKGGGGQQQSATEQSESHDSTSSEEHKHVYGEYEHDETGHWKECTICHEKTEKEAHTGGTSTCTQRAICSVCGAEYGALEEHQYGEWQYVDGEENHYRECSVCHDKEYAPHNFVIEKVCDECLVGEYSAACEATNTYYKSCACGAHSHSAEDTFTVENHHEFTLEEVLDGDANLISPATCEEAAVYGKVCEHCHAAFSTEATFVHGDPKPHTMVHYDEEMTFATYHKEYYFCTECEKYFLDEREEGALEPVYVEAQPEDIFDDTKGQYGNDEYGTEENPYIIANKTDLNAVSSLIFAGTTTFEGKYLNLDADLDYKEGEFKHCIGVGATGGKSFSGTFDGQGHTINGLSLERNEGCIALFGHAVDATIKNINLSNIRFKALATGDTAQRVGAFIGRAERTTIENCHALSGLIDGEKENGGIVGVVVNGSTIKNCTNRAEVKGNAAGIGGILGKSYSGDVLVENCTNYGNVTSGSENAAGTVGTAQGGNLTIKDCTNKGDVIASTYGSGGVLGRIESSGTTTVVGCKNEGTVNGGTADGCAGIVAFHNKSSGTLYISYCWNDGTVQRASGKSGNGTGGILGLNKDNAISHISKCKNTGDVKTETAPYVGGIVGLARIASTNTITDCYVASTIQGRDKLNTGAIAGINRQTITYCEVAASTVIKTADGSFEDTVDHLPEPQGETGTHSVLTFVYGSQNTGGTTNNCRVITPVEVTVTVTYDAGFGNSFYLMGSFNRWADESAKADNRYQLTWTEGNVWVGTFIFAAGDTIEYKLVIAPTGYDAEIGAWQSGDNLTLAIAVDMNPNVELTW